MKREQLIFVVLGSVAALLLWSRLPRETIQEPEDESLFDRVVFVCCDDHGNYSPGIYWHGATGGGPACLPEVKKAARYMRAGDPQCSAAAFCGYSFKVLGDDIATGGGVALCDAPKPGTDGSVDWQAYCSWNVDLILINVNRGTAQCYVSPEDPKAPRKQLVRRLTDLKFGDAP
jgi:hypothetical protein